MKHFNLFATSYVLLCFLSGSNEAISWTSSSSTLPQADYNQFSGHNTQSTFPKCIFILGGSICPTCVSCYNISSNTITPNWDTLTYSATNKINTASAMIGDDIYFVHNHTIRKYNVFFKTDTILMENNLINQEACMVSTPNNHNKNNNYLFIANGNFSTSFFGYSINSSTLISGSDQPNARYGQSCVSTYDSITNTAYMVVISGNSEYIDVINLDNAVVTAFSERWYTLSQTLTISASGMHYNYGRFSAVVSYNEYIWLIGGLDGYDDSRTNDVTRIKIVNFDFDVNDTSTLHLEMDYLGEYVESVSSAQATLVMVEKEYIITGDVDVIIENAIIYVWGGFDGAEEVDTIAYGVCLNVTRYVTYPPIILTQYEEPPDPSETSTTKDSETSNDVTTGVTLTPVNTNTNREDSWIVIIVSNNLFLPLVLLFGLCCCLICSITVYSMFRTYVNRDRNADNPKRNKQKAKSKIKKRDIGEREAEGKKASKSLNFKMRKNETEMADFMSTHISSVQSKTKTKSKTNVSSITKTIGTNTKRELARPPPAPAPQPQLQQLQSDSVNIFVLKPRPNIAESLRSTQSTILPTIPQSYSSKTTSHLSVQKHDHHTTNTSPTPFAYNNNNNNNYSSSNVNMKQRSRYSNASTISAFSAISGPDLSSLAVPIDVNKSAAMNINVSSDHDRMHVNGNGARMSVMSAQTDYTAYTDDTCTMEIMYARQKKDLPTSNGHVDLFSGSNDDGGDGKNDDDHKSDYRRGDIDGDDNNSGRGGNGGNGDGKNKGNKKDVSSPSQMTHMQWKSLISKASKNKSHGSENRSKKRKNAYAGSVVSDTTSAVSHRYVPDPNVKMPPKHGKISSHIFKRSGT